MPTEERFTARKPRDGEEALPAQADPFRPDRNLPDKVGTGRSQERRAEKNRRPAALGMTGSGRCQQCHKQIDLKLTLSSSIRAWDVANPKWRKAMKNRKERFLNVGKKVAAGGTLGLCIGGEGGVGVAGGE